MCSTALRPLKGNDMRALAIVFLLLHSLWLTTAWAQTGGGRGSAGSSASGGRGGGSGSTGEGGGGGFNRQPPVITPPPAVVAAPAARPVLPSEIEQGQLLMLSKDFSSTRQVLATLAAESIRPMATTRLRALGWDMALFQFADQATAQQLLPQWQQRFPQMSVDFNYLYRTQAGEGAEGGREYALGMLDLPAQTAAPSARQVRIGLLDTRVEPTAWLQQATLTRRPFTQDATTTAAATSRQPEQAAHPAHGTAIASLVARVTPRVHLYAAEVMAARGEQAVTNSYRLIQGVDWLLTHRVQAINVSLAGRYDNNLATTVDALMQRNVIVIAAAGNQGNGAPPAYPAAYASTRAGMLAVTAIDVAGQLYQQANRGSYVSVAAPGVQIWVPAASTAGGGASGARYVSGTSYASAYAAGAVAQWLAKNPDQPGAAATQRLRATAKDLGPAGRDESYGEGLVQVNAAMRP
jgi:hypothetical protein